MLPLQRFCCLLHCWQRHIWRNNKENVFMIPWQYFSYLLHCWPNIYKASKKDMFPCFHGNASAIYYIVDRHTIMSTIKRNLLLRFHNRKILHECPQYYTKCTLNFSTSLCNENCWQFRLCNTFFCFRKWISFS